jgi:TonB family protein
MNTIVVARIALAVAAVGFLMPWMGVSLFGSGGPSFSGFTLATGLMGGRYAGGAFWPYSAAGIAVLVAMLLSFSGDGKSTGGATGAVSVLAIAATLGGMLWMHAEVDRQAYGMGGLLQEGAGYWLTVISLAVAAVTGFMASAGKEMPKLALQAGAAPARTADDDVAAWDRIANKDNADALQEYLLRHPDGRFSELARMKLERMGVAPLKPAAPPAAPEPAPAAKPALADDLLFPSETTPRVAEKVVADDLLAGASSVGELPKEPGPVSAPALVAGGVLVLLLAGGGVAWWVFNGGLGSSAPEAAAPGTVVEREVANEPAPPVPPSWDELLGHRQITFDVSSPMELDRPIDITFRISPPGPGAPNVEDTVSANLIGRGFDIQMETVERQRFARGANEWRWTVTPREKGEQTLTLELAGHSAADGSAKLVEMFRQAVRVAEIGVVPPGQSGPYWPAAPVRVTATEARFREAPAATPQTKVLGVATPGEELDVVGLAKQPDWYWYEVRFDDGSTGFIRSDLTSAPMRDSPAPPPQVILPDFDPNASPTNAIPPPVNLVPPPASTAQPAASPTRPSPDQYRLFRWLSDSYPASALRARQQGDVTVSMCVGPDGRARDVRLEKSSGVAALDQTTVTEIGSVRFEPGRDAAGNPVDWCNPRYQLLIAWRLPG